MSFAYALEFVDVYHLCTDFCESKYSGMMREDLYLVKFLQRLPSGWNDLTALLLVLALEEIHFFWCAFFSKEPFISFLL